MKEKLLKAIILVMAAVMVFGMTTMMFSAVEAGDNIPTTTAKPTTTETPTTEKPADNSTTANSDNSTTANADTSTTAAPTTTEPTTVPIVTFDDKPTTAPPTQAPTKAPSKNPSTNPTQKPSSNNKKPSGGSAGVVATTLPEELSSEEFTTDYIFEDPTTQYVWTFADETTEAEKDDDGVNVKKIIIIAVIVVAVVGAGVCLIILGKKQ